MNFNNQIISECHHVDHSSSRAAESRSLTELAQRYGTQGTDSQVLAVIESYIHVGTL